MINNSPEKQLTALILAGYTDNKEKAEDNKKRLKNKLSVEYLEGVNKALIGMSNGYPMLQKIVDTYNGSKYISDTVIIGPANELKDGGITGAEFIDTNADLAEKLRIAFSELKGQTLAVGFSDTPWIETNHIDNYIESVEPHLDEKSFIFQLVEKTNENFHKMELANSDWKPSYFFKSEEHEGEGISTYTGVKHEVFPGHLQIVNPDNLPEFVYNLMDFIYKNKGESVSKRIAKFAWNFPKAFSVSIGLAVKYYQHNFYTSQLEKGLGRLDIPTHIQLTQDMEFALDVDTVREEKEVLDYLVWKKINLDSANNLSGDAYFAKKNSK